MTIKWFVALFLIVCLASGFLTAKGQHLYKTEQRHFSAEAIDVEKPVSVPNDVIDILRKDERVRSALDDQGITAERLPTAWFSASLVHLGNSSQPDMIVQGKGPILGANVTTFWVFSTTPRGHELVLRTIAHDLLVQGERRNGRLEIQTMSATAVKVNTRLFKFEGKQYLQYQSQTEQVH